jgi:O-antigen/teichoic acid export membrane protein
MWIAGGSMLRQSSGGLAAKLLGLGCGFVYAVGAARLLGATGYGIVAVAVSAVTVVATLATLGINALAVREAASLTARNARTELASFVRWSLSAVGLVAIITAVGLAAFSALTGPYRQSLLFGALAVPLLAGLLLLRGIVQGTGAVIAAQLPLEVGRWLLTIAIIALLLFLGERVGPSAVMLAVVAGLAAAFAGAAVYTFRLLPNLALAAQSERRGRYWLGQAFPFLAIALIGIVGTEISTLLLGWLASPHEAGLYQPIAKLAPLMMLANEAIETALAPRLVHLLESGERQQLQRLVARSAVASAIGTAAIAGAILIASPLILRVFGPEFTRYQHLLLWIAVAQVINAGTGAAPLLLAMSGDMKRRVRAQAATLIVQAGLAVLLIPSLGATGAVISLVAAILTWSLVHWWIALRAMGIDTSVRGASHGASGGAA